jgi:hypothetical protein
MAGEYFVAAELYRRGYSVAITIGNAKAIDLFAERDARAVNVQVKAIRDARSVGWPIMRDRVLDGVVYIFVCLNEPGRSPDYFICTPEEARANTAQYATRGIIDLRKLRRPDYQERWDKLDQLLEMPAASVVRRQFESARRSRANDQAPPESLAMGLGSPRRRATRTGD